MKEKLQAIREKAIEKIKSCDNLDKLNEIRVAYLGKKGELTEVLKGMKDVAADERPKVGAMVNDTRAAIEEKLEEIKNSLVSAAREARLKKEDMKLLKDRKSNTIIITLRHSIFLPIIRQRMSRIHSILTAI